jgi:hypothetical protein
MKKISLSKELLLNGVLIGALSIGLVSCGSGGGGGSGSTSLSFGGSGPSTPTSPGGIGPSTPLSYSLATYLYAGTDHFNEPIITVYIDGKPVKLLADTGHSGLVVNSSAVNIPSSDIYSSSTFIEFFHNDNYTLSGTMAIATVCLNPSITNSCVLMKIGVLEPSDDGLFSTSSEAQGDFGLASGFNSLDSSGNITGYSYPTYLEKQYGINSYTISFYPLSNGYYSNVSSTTPIGYISFGVYNGNSNTFIPYNFYNASGQPKTIVVFPSSTSSTTSFAGYAIFDSSYRYNILSTSVFQIEIPNFNQGLDEGPCTTLPSNILNGGYNITYSLQNNNGVTFYSGSFTTEPSSSFCQAGNSFNLMEGITLDYDLFTPNSLEPKEIFGLPAMLGHTFTWVLGTSGTNQGFVQGISINP